MGGPVVRGKTFFYLNYEGLRQRLDGTQIGLVPSPAFAARLAITSPALVPILQAYPAGTSPTSSASVWNYHAQGRQVDNEDSGMIRFDHYFSTRTSAFVRFNTDEAVQSIPSGNLVVKALTNMGSAAYTAILPLVRQRKTQYFGYAQDQWQATPDLTITAGIRYDSFNALHAIGNNDVPFDFVTCGGYCPRVDVFFIRGTPISTRDSASRGRFMTWFCALARGFIIPMARRTTRTCRSRIRWTGIRSATQRSPRFPIH